jgi:DNA-binding GntR family transcriptional regulator
MTLKEDAIQPHTPSMVERIAASIRDSIYSGELKPGTAIRQQALAVSLDVSRIPVREALRQLESEGLVVRKPNSGVKVAVLDFQEYSDIYKLRERVEPLAISESIPNMTPAQKAETGRLLAELHELVGDPAAFLEADRRFHLSCYVGASRIITTMVEGFWNTTQRHRRLLLATYSTADFGWTNWEHRLIYNCIVSGNTRAAEEAIRMHIERTRLRLAEHPDLFDW